VLYFIQALEGVVLAWNLRVCSSSRSHVRFSLVPIYGGYLIFLKKKKKTLEGTLQRTWEIFESFRSMVGSTEIFDYFELINAREPGAFGLIRRNERNIFFIIYNFQSRCSCKMIIFRLCLFERRK